MGNNVESFQLVRDSYLLGNQMQVHRKKYIYHNLKSKK